MDGNTKIFSVTDLEDEVIKNTLHDISDSLKEVGYNPVNQIVGYLMSGDPGYISSHGDARKKITKLDRIKVMELLLREFISK